MQEIIKFIEYNQYNLSFIIQVIGFYILLLWLAVVAWVIRDITTRSQNLFVVLFTATFVLFGNLPALVLYLLLRPEKTIEENKSYDLFFASIMDKDISVCPDCSNLVRNEFKFCPTCSATLESVCPECEHHINPLWKYCGFCNYNLMPKPLYIRMANTSRNFVLNTFTITRKIVTFPFHYIKVPSKLSARLPKLALSKFMPKFMRRFALPKFKVQISMPKLPKFNFRPVKKLKTLAEKRHQPKEQSKVVKVEKPAKKADKKTKTSEKKKGRGRPKGTTDQKPRRKRADAGKKRGKYKK